MDNFGPLLRVPCHLPNANHSAYSSLNPRSLGPCNEIVSLNLAECLVGFEPETVLFICNTLICCATLPKLRFSR